MHTIGVVGGLGPESTIEYHRLMIAEYRPRHPDGGNPSIIINSIDVGAVLGFFGADDLAAATDYSWLRSSNWRAPARRAGCSPPTPRTRSLTIC